MKISRNWLQTFFDSPLPNAQVLSDALTFHAFEVESLSTYEVDSVADSILDVKVTPNRGADSLSHRGIAKEISAILHLPMKHDPLRELVSLKPAYGDISLYIENDDVCRRYIAGYIKGVKVGPSPDWLKQCLESIGQKSINNVVDAANFVMLNLGQPLHAFDANKLGKRPAKGKSEYKIQVRNAKKGEKITTLDGKEYKLSDSMLAIVDANADAVIGIAGVKGGKTAEVNESTKDIIIESANFDGVSVRKTAQALKLRTDASQRFEQGISAELAGYGMRSVTDLILKIAGGELVGFVDEYPSRQPLKQVAISATQTNRILGTALEEKDIADALTRLGLPFEQKDETFTVTVPFERLDLNIPEDLVEEIARIAGYDKIPSTELSPLDIARGKPEINEHFYSAEKTREELAAMRYSEVFTSVFADKGGRAVLNKVGEEKSYLRATLIDGLQEALEKNKHNKDILGLAEIRLFEIGTVWRGGREEILLGTADEKGVHEEPLQNITASAYGDLSISKTARYQQFSRYPFIVRDIALWVSVGTKSDEVLEVIRKESSALLVRSELFDTFEKAGKISFAFRLVFQSFEKTLTDEEANSTMERVNLAVQKQGWEVR